MSPTITETSVKIKPQIHWFNNLAIFNNCYDVQSVQHVVLLNTWLLIAQDNETLKIIIFTNFQWDLQIRLHQIKYGCQKSIVKF